MTKYMYRFGGGAQDGGAGDKNLLGGKGANLDGMAAIGLPVPPGFTLTTEVCTAYYANGENYPEELADQVATGIAHIEATTGRSFGDPANPLLVSVRSGARVSMPGMMDTVLNLGLNDATVEGLAASSGDARFAWDSYRRFIQMYADVVLSLDHDSFEEALEIAKEDKGIWLDTEMEAEDWRALVGEYKKLVEKQWGQPFPQDVNAQLWGAVGAVFGSWESERAKVYRRLNHIPADWGTAVNVQAMVFGNMGETSATGVAFTRDPATGENAYYGEYLINAQGEDVVAGIRTPQYLTKEARARANAKPLSMEEAMPEVYGQLADVFAILETHYRDMQDIEFTVERGKLWMLQTRSGKRTSKAALRIAVDMANEGLITRGEAVGRVDASASRPVAPPHTRSQRTARCADQGVACVSGGGFGQDRVRRRYGRKWAEKGEAVILVRIETSPKIFTACTRRRAF
jgi:pyruvate,orthophosphate dikinase